MDVDEVAPTQVSATLVENSAPGDLADVYRLEAAHILDGDKRGELGQFFTPASIAQFMASLVSQTREINLLDAGAGAGALTAALVQAALGWDEKPKCIRVTAYEVDEVAIHLLRSTLNECYQLCVSQGVEFSYKIICGDFIEKASEMVSGQRTLFDAGSIRWNLAILNPPYRKINTDSHERLALRRAGIETSNLYAAFVWLTAKLMSEDGQIVAITPRSFCNGPYFLPFRKALFNEFRFERIHLFESRDRAFRDDEILQENIIFKLVKSKSNEEVIISESFGADDELITQRLTNHSDIVRPDDAEMFVHIVPNETGMQIRQTAQNLDCSLDDLGLSVSTGRVVDFRAKAALRDFPEANKTVPLIYPQHISEGVVKWPSLTAKKPNAIVNDVTTQSLLIPNGHYVLVRRFSAKEEKRRVVAAITCPEQFTTDSVGIENHLNYFHAKGQGLDKEIAKGLAAFLNSPLVDQYFRQFNGHTQVNAADLKSLRYPNLKQLRRIGVLSSKDTSSQAKKVDELEIQRFVSEELNIMATQSGESNQSNTSDSAKTHKHIKEGLDILRALNLPKEQQNQRSSLTLLALLDVKPESSWSQAAAPARGITEIMDFARDQYGFQYAPNTRETFRRFTMHQFVQIGIAIANPDAPQRPTNSPKFSYQIAPDALKLIQSYGTKKWKQYLAAYLATVKTLQVLQAKERSMALLPVRLPNGDEVVLSGGGQNPLIKQIIEVFCPRFTPNSIVVYIGDTGRKMRGDEIAYLKTLGVSVNQHGKMPDVIIHIPDKNWLVIIEAVTSHGPINIKRHNELKELFGSSKTGLVFVTTFETRQKFAQYLKEIAWETDVWIAESPSHLIHFNGERFLGPY